MSNQRMRDLFLESIERQRMGGDLVAGKRKKPAKKYSKATPAQLEALRKARKALKKKRGGDFEDVGDSAYRLFGAAYKNPISRAKKAIQYAKEDAEWDLDKGWLEKGNLTQQDIDNKVLRYVMANPGIPQKDINDYMAAEIKKAIAAKEYNKAYINYKEEEEKLKKGQLYLNLLRKYGIKPTAQDIKDLSA